MSLPPPIMPDIDLNFDGKVDIDPTELRGIEVPNWELVPMTPNGGTVGTEAAPALPLTAEATPAAPINAKEKVGDDILASYKERFGINPEDLEGIEGFDTLSRGQQKQALENLAQLTIGRIHEEAIDGQAEDIAQQKKNAKFLGKVWISLKDSFTKKYNVIGREKQLAADIQKGGIDTHKAVLAQMVSGMKELGPEIKEGADGALEVQYIETGGLSPEVAKVAEVFNEQATKLSKIPHDWGMETATPAQQQAYKEAQDIYQLQRGVLMKHMSDAGGDAMALKAIAKTESQMEMQRFIQTCPDAAEELKGIKNEKAWKEALKSVGTERGLYFAGGAAARTALGLMGGLVFAPIVAAGIAGMRGWKRSGEALLAQDKAQQRGEVIITPKMQAARDRMAHISDELAHVDNAEVKAALTAELGTLESAALGTTKNMIAAVREEGDNESGYRGSSEKMNALVMKIKAAEEKGEDTSTLQAKLKRRIDYTNLKIAEGKMVFGDNNERLGNQYTLTKAMSTAEVMLAGETVTDEHGDKAERRLAKLLDKSEEETNDARFKKKAKDALFAGTIGGVAASAGAEFADAVKWMNGAGGTMSEKMFGNAADLKAYIAGAGTSVMGAAKEFGENLEQTTLGAAQSLHAELTTGASTVSTEYVDGSRGLATEQPYIPYGETLRSATEASPDYPVVQGDNLSKIFAREIPGSTNPDVYRALKGMTPEELTKLGVTSGNIDLIHPGDKINVEMMKEYLAAHPGAAVAEAGTGDVAEAAHTPSTVFENDGTPSSTAIDAHPGHGPGEVGPTVSEANPLIPARKLSELTSDEINHWPESKASPWPVNEHEADDLFGRVGSGDRKLAEHMRAAIGRYPNEEELTGFKSIQNLDVKAGHDMLLEMKKHPQSFADIKQVVRPVLTAHVGTGTAPTSGVKTYMEGGRRVDVVTAEQAGSTVYHEGKETDVVLTPTNPTNTTGGGVSAEQFAKSIEAGRTPIRLSDLTPQERIRFGPAIKALTLENGGKFPDGISADEVVKKELDIEAGKGYSPVQHARHPQVAQATARTDNSSINTAARVLGAVTGNKQLKDIAEVVASATQPKATGVTAGMMQVSQAMTRGTQSPETRAIGGAIGELFKKS